MHTSSLPPSLAESHEPIATGDVDVVLASARLLQQADLAGETHTLLRGKKLGLVCTSEHGADASLFRRAASALGASVSHIRPSLFEPAASAADLKQMARVLGRLYDGIECQGLPPSVVRQMGRDAGVPVYDGIACPGHRTAQFAPLLAGSEPIEQKRQLILEAVLMSTLG